MADWMSPWLAASIPLAGAMVGLAAWSRPRMLKVLALVISLASLLVLVGLAGRLPGPATGLLVVYLLPVAAFVSLLGQPAHPDNRAAWLATLLLLGLGLGALTSQGSTKLVLLALVFGLVGVLTYRYRGMSVSDPWRGIAACSLGVACALVALVADPQWASLAFLVVCAILLPLAPVHGGYVAALTGLPGNLPAFLALLLPGLGFHALLTLLPDLSAPAAQTLVILAAAGALYGTLKALAQSRVRSLLAYAGLVFFSILWWYLAAVRVPIPHTAIYLGSVSVSVSGLLLVWYAIQARYGDVDLRAIRGLVYPMPKFSILLSLLALAAMGLPPFGVFSGFMGMLLAPSLPLSGALIAILIAWLADSWYFLELVQQLMFGPQRRDVHYEDLRRSEFAALLAFVVLLLALGLVPPRVLDPGSPIPQARPVAERLTWNR